MGPLSLPASGSIYIDANVLIYSVERIQPYVRTLDSFWLDVSVRRLHVFTSELTALETLVGPLKTGETALETLFRQALYASPDLHLAPIALPILERAARLRATTPSLKTPDAIHAATALVAGCALFVTNDAAFSHVPGLNVKLLRDMITP
ncbi:MAG TPA: PIN domain-containing protein [Ktedonobacterales bacterium]|nr:PIN domain-containing protein [Ktedonobacterales bacterium]